MEHIKTALDIYVAQNAAINTLWNIFLVVTVAILGYVYKDRTLMDDWKIKIGLSIGFILFALTNDFAMARSQSIVVAASNYFKGLPASGDPSFDSILKAHDAISVRDIHSAHILYVLLVLVAMWLPNIATALFQKRARSKKPA